MYTCYYGTHIIRVWKIEVLNYSFTIPVPMTLFINPHCFCPLDLKTRNLVLGCFLKFFNVNNPLPYSA